MRTSLVPTALSLFLLATPSLSAAEAATADEWPGLRGPSHDGAVRDAELFDGGPAGLEVVWKRPIGPGYPVPVVDEERVIAVFQSGDSDVVAAFDRASGEELWRRPLGEAYAGHTGSHDGPIATPALAGGRVFALGPRGDLLAVDAATGELLWRRHLVDDLEAEAPYYGFATSPLVAGDVLVLEIGAGAGRTVAGLGVADGELLWSAGDDRVRYQSPILWRLGDETQVVAVGNRTVSGLDPATGEVLWSHEHAGDEGDMGGNTIVPVPAGPGRLLLANRHPESVMLEVGRNGSGGSAVRELWTSSSLKASYVQPVYHDGHLYGMNGKIFTCVDAATGELVWRSREPGDGFPTIVGDHLVVMSKPGVLRVARASSEGYEEVASLDLFDDVSWSAPAFAGGSLWVRSMGELARVEPAAAAAAVAAGGEDGSHPTRGVFARFLGEVEAAGDPGAKAALVDAFLASRDSWPLVEEDGTVRFLYRGEADDVGIVGDMIGWRREDPMTRVPGTDLFHYSSRLEPDAAVTYGFLVDFGDPVPDPLNPERAEGVFGEISWLAMPARTTPAYLEGAAAESGRIEEIEWESGVREGQTRRARVYLPTGYDEAGERRYPTVYVLDGAEALEEEEGALPRTLDHVLGTSVEPLVAVFVLSDPENPRRDLGDASGYTEMVASELVPLVDERYRTLSDPLDRGVVGAGGAGDAALHAAFHHPDRFSRAGALWPILFPRLPEVPSAAERPLVLHLTWGTYHMRSPHENFDSGDQCRELWQELREAGHRPAGGEVPEGMGWAAWRAYTGEMLRDLFPGRSRD